MRDTTGAQSSASHEGDVGAPKEATGSEDERNEVDLHATGIESEADDSHRDHATGI